MSEKTSAAKSTRAAARVRGIVKEINLRAHQAKADGVPIAYCMNGSQYEPILYAMGIETVFTEAYSSLCAVKRKAEPYLLRAEAEGFSNSICGYVRVGLGFEYERQAYGIPDDAPDGGMPEPDLLLGSGATCDPRFKWYQAAGRYLNVPTYAHDILFPPVHCDLNAIEPYYVRYQLEQFKGLVDFLEQHTKRKLDLDKLDFAFERSQDVLQLWYECDMLRKAVPGPLPTQDSFNIFVPAFYRCFADSTVQFYRDLYAELQERIANKVGVIEDERYRLLWLAGPPPWHSMWVFNYFEERGAVFVMDRVYRRFDPVEIPRGIAHPLEKLAYRTYWRLAQRVDQIRLGTGDTVADIREFKIDGIVAHVTKSCRVGSLGQLYLSNVIRHEVNVPFLQLQSDLIDVRDFSAEQWKSSIDSFIETMANAKS